MAHIQEVKKKQRKLLKDWAESGVGEKDVFQGRLAKASSGKERLLIALEKTIGNVTKACALVDITRTTFYDWVHTDDDFRAAVEEIQLNLVPDFLEHCLFDASLNGNAATIIYGLNNKGKHRGWSNEQHLAIRTIPQATLAPSAGSIDALPKEYITLDAEYEEIDDATTAE